jgi:hypothetical protein
MSLRTGTGAASGAATGGIRSRRASVSGAASAGSAGSPAAVKSSSSVASRRRSKAGGSASVAPAVLVRQDSDLQDSDMAGGREGGGSGASQPQTLPTLPGASVGTALASAAEGLGGGGGAAVGSPSDITNKASPARKKRRTSMIPPPSSGRFAGSSKGGSASTSKKAPGGAGGFRSRFGGDLSNKENGGMNGPEALAPSTGVMTRGSRARRMSAAADPVMKQMLL